MLQVYKKHGTLWVYSAAMEKSFRLGTSCRDLDVAPVDWSPPSASSSDGPCESPNHRGPDLKSGDLATDRTKWSVCYATRIKTPKASGFFVQVRTLVLEAKLYPTWTVNVMSMFISLLNFVFIDTSWYKVQPPTHDPRKKKAEKVLHLNSVRRETTRVSLESQTSIRSANCDSTWRIWSLPSSFEDFQHLMIWCLYDFDILWPAKTESWG